MSFLVWIIAGIIAGWLTGMLVRGAGYGLLGDLAIGLIGGLIGGALAGVFGIQPQPHRFDPGRGLWRWYSSGCCIIHPEAV
jgi:uncharacterized membrane protein YeaQ/YmgE (transglycosylase-associated protein family)